MSIEEDLKAATARATAAESALAFANAERDRLTRELRAHYEMRTAAEQQVEQLAGDVRAAAEDYASEREITAAQAIALAEARGALREVVRMTGVGPSVPPGRKQAPGEPWYKKLVAVNAFAAIALARAGEQEVGRAWLPPDDALDAKPAPQPAGEPASSGQGVEVGSRRFGKTEALKQAAREAIARNPDAVIAWAFPRAGPDQPWHAPATPPPGEQGKGADARCREHGAPHVGGESRFYECGCAEPEQGKGKGGGEGLECGQIGERWVCVKPLWHAGLHAYELRPAPAQPAEHPASGGEDRCTGTLVHDPHVLCPVHDR